MSAEFLKVIRDNGGQSNARLHTAILATIIQYDPVLMQADLQPLLNDPGFEYAPILHASVSCLRAGGFIIRPPYQPGDIVVAVVIERGIDGVFATGEKADRVGARRHSLTDAVVVGGFTPRPRPLPEQHGEKLYIGTDDGVNWFTMDIEGNMTVSIKGVFKVDAAEIRLNCDEEEGEA